MVDVLQRCLVRDVKQRASIQELLNHSYLKSEPIKVVKNHLDVDLKSFEQMTPNTFKREIHDLKVVILLEHLKICFLCKNS